MEILNDAYRMYEHGENLAAISHRKFFLTSDLMFLVSVHSVYA